MKRRLAREMVVSSLFQIEFNDVAPELALGNIIEQIMVDNEISDKVSDPQTDEFARQLLFGVLENKVAIDEILVKYLKGWQVDRLSNVDRQVLRLATYEMIYQSNNVPPKVALNEAIELAKHFGFEESGKFVNGVLAKLLTSLESDEI